MTRHIQRQKIKSIIKVLETMTEHMKTDIEEMSTKPFDAKTVSEMFGCQGAAIAALASVIKDHLENPPKRGR